MMSVNLFECSPCMKDNVRRINYKVKFTVTLLNTLNGSGTGYISADTASSGFKGAKFSLVLCGVSEINNEYGWRPLVGATPREILDLPLKTSFLGIFYRNGSFLLEKRHRFTENLI